MIAALLAVLAHVPPALAATEDVTWTRVVNATTPGRALRKWSTTATWDAGATSTKGIASGSGYVEFVVPSTSTLIAAGLGQGDSSPHYNDIDFAIYLGGSGVQVYESGTLRGSFGSYQVGNRFRVSVDDGTVRYWRNGTVFYTSTRTAAYPLLMDAALMTPSSLVGVEEAAITGDLVEVAAARPAFSIPSGNYPTSQTVVLTTSTDAAQIHYTASGADPAESDPWVSSEGTVVVDQSAVVKAQAFKLGLLPSLVARASYTISADAVTEDVTWTRLVNSLASGNDLRKWSATANWDAGAVSTKAIVSTSGYVEFTAQSVASTLVAGLGIGDAGPHYSDIEFGILLTGSTVQVYESGLLRGSFGSFQAGNRFRVSVDDGTVRYWKNGTVFYTSAVPAAYPLLMDAALSTQNGAAGVEDATISGVLAEAVSPVALSVPGGNYPSTQTVALTTTTAGARIYYTTNGVDPTENDPWLESGGTVIVAESLTLKAQAIKPGLLPSLVTRATYTIGQASVVEDVAWTRIVNAAASGNDLRKWSATGNWDAGAVSTKAIVSSSGSVEFTAASTSSLLMVGLGNGDAGATYNDVEFAVFLNNATLQVYESGALRGTFGTFTVGTRFRISVDDGIVRYWKGDTVFYTSAQPATYPLLMDASLMTQNGLAGVEDARISGVLAETAVAAVTFSVPGGNYPAAQAVALSTTTDGARIHYTSNGADPTEDDPWVNPGETVSVVQSATLKAQAFKSGLLSSLVTRAAYTIGQTPVEEDVAWTRLVNTLAFGNDLRKWSPTATWDAGAVSTKGIVSSSGYVQFTARSITNNTLAGLGEGDTAVTSADVEFGIYLASATVQVLEAGVGRGSFGTFQIGDTFRVSVDDGRVRYSKNGVVFYTSARAANYPLLMDTALSTQNGLAGVEDARIGGVLADVAVGTVGLSVPGGNYPAAQTVALSTATDGARIHYTLNGADPTEADLSVDSGETVTVAESATLKAQAFKTGLLPSLVMRASYTIGGTPVEEDVTWTRVVNAIASGNDLRKWSATANWDAGATSTKGIVSSAGYVEFTAGSTLSSIVAGLGEGDTNPTHADPEFAIYLSGSTIQVLESGTGRGAFGAFQVGDRFRVSVDDGRVRYWKNGVVFYTSARVAQYPLLMDAALLTQNGAAGVEDARIGGVLVDVAAGTVTLSVPAGNYPAPQTVALSTITEGARIHYTLNGADPTESDLWVNPGETVSVAQSATLKAQAFKTGLLPSLVTRASYTIAEAAAVEDVVWTRMVGAVATANHLRKWGLGSAWDAGAVSTKGIASSSGSVEFTAQSTATTLAAGLGQGDSSLSHTDIEYAIYLGGNVITVYESGTSRGTFGSFQAGDRFRVSVDNGVVRYARNGIVFYTSARSATYPLLMDAALNTSNRNAGIEDAKISGVLVDVAVAPVLLSVPGGNYPSGQSVALSSGTDGVRIHYTTSGAEPTETDPSVNSGETVSIDQTAVLKAKGFKANLLPSFSAQAFYTIGQTAVEEDVLWTRLVNAQASGNDLRKWSATANWDAGAVSTKAIVSSSGYVEFTARSTTTTIAAGLGQGDSAALLTDVDFGIQLSGSSVTVLENGTSRGAFGTFVIGDRFRVSVDDGVVRYWKNGNLLYVSGKAVQYPLVLDGALATQNGAVGIEDARIAGVLADFAVAPVTVSVPGGNYPAAQTVTVATATDGARIHFTTNGVDPTEGDPSVNSGETVTVSQTGTLKVQAFKTGLLPSLCTKVFYTIGQTATEEDVLWTRLVKSMAFGNDLRKSSTTAVYDGGAVSTKGIVSSSGYVEFTAGSVAVTLAAGLGQDDASALLADIEFGLQLAGNAVSVVESGTTRGSFGTFVVGDRFRVSVDDGVVRYAKNGAVFYTSGRLAQYPLLLDAALATQSGAAGVEDARIAGVFADMAVAPVTVSVPGGNYPVAQTVTLSTATGGARIHYTMNAADPTEGDPSLDSGETTTVSQTGTLRAAAFKSGLLPSLATRAFYTIGGMPVVEDIVWTHRINTTADGNDLRKTSGGAGTWDAGGASTRAIVSSSGYLELTAGSTSTNVMAGLGNGDVGVAYTDIEFAIYLTSNFVDVYESGASRGRFGTFVTGDRLRVSVDSGVVRYWKNDVVFYTSAVPATYPLLVDASIHTLRPTVGVEDAVLYGVLQEVFPPALKVTPAALDFGEVRIGQSATLPLTIENRGTSDLQITQLALRAGSSADYALGTLASTVIPPGISRTVDVTYTPGEVGADGGVVDVRSSEGWAAVPLSGLGARTYVSLSIVPAEATLAVGDALPLRAMAALSSGPPENVTSQATWSSASPEIAEVSAVGLVTAKAVGTATVTASFEGLNATATLTVVTPGTLRITLPPPGSVAPGAIFEADVTLDAGAQALGAYAVRMEIDPTVAKVLAVLGGDGVFSAAPAADPSTFNSAAVLFAGYQVAVLDAPRGPVRVARIQFEVVGTAGSSMPVTLTAVTAAATDLRDIPWTNIPARLVVAP